jgi:hypothetical protein
MIPGNRQSFRFAKRNAAVLILAEALRFWEMREDDSQ